MQSLSSLLVRFTVTGFWMVSLSVIVLPFLLVYALFIAHDLSSGKEKFYGEEA